MSVSLCAQSHLCHVWGLLSTTLNGHAARGWCKPITFELRGGLCGLIRDSLFMAILKVSWAWHPVTKAEFMGERLDSYFSMSTVCNFPHTFTQQRKGCSWKGHKSSSLQLVDCLTQAKAAFRDYIFNNPLSYKSLPLNPFPVKSFLYFLKT